VSGSTAGAPIANAKRAAKSFVAQIPAGVRIGLVAFGDRANVRADFTTDKARLGRLIDGLVAGGDTALYDAIALSSSRLGRVAGAQHNVVVFSDGKDTVKRTSLTQAVVSARAAQAAVTAVALRTADLDPASLNALATATGGRVIQVGQSAALAGAFQQVAKEIGSQYVLTYVSTATKPSELDIAVTLNLGGASVVDTVTVLNSRAQPVGPGGTALPALKPAKPLVGFFGSKTGLYVGIGGAFVAAMLFFGMLLYQPGGGQAVKVLQRGLRLYTRSERRKVQQERTGISATAIGRAAVDLVSRVPRTEGVLERLQNLLDRASSVPIRATEFILIQVVGVVVGAILGFGLFGRWWMGVVLMAFGFIGPRLVLLQKVNSRASAFLSQLPDTLQLLAGSLQAGYGFLQAIDTIVKEAQPPTSTEFSRVLAESRLGMPIEDALNTMSERVGGDDFRWVVLAINIQRQVGGNLAALLQTVANTLREREAVRRQIKVLSAEGRLSAVILVALPFVLFGYISLANPSYLHSLTSETVGKFLIAGALGLIVVGALWMRKIIKIDV
jgi:tight adherence protein B